MEKSMVEIIGRRKRLLLFILISIAIIGVCFRDISKLLLPHVLSDEFGYWSVAAFLAGYDWSEVTSQVVYYSFGYGVILTPLFWIFDNPVSIHTTAILLNGIFIIGSFAISCVIAEKYIQKEQSFFCILAAAISIIYPNTIAQTNTTFSESFLIFLVWVMVYVVYSLGNKPSFIKVVAISVLAVYLYFVHQRMLGVLLAWGICLLFMLYNKKIDKKILVASIVLIVVLFLLGTEFKQYIQEHLWLNSETLSGNDYSGQLTKVQNILSDTNLLFQTFVIASGQIFGVIVSSYFLVVFGIIVCIKRLPIVRKFVIDKEEFLDNDHLPELFLLFSNIFIIGISSIFFQTPSRIDMLYYGRYIEVTIPPMILLGLLYLFKLVKDDRFKQICFWSGILVSICYFSSIEVTKYVADNNLTVFNPNNSVGMSSFYYEGEMDAASAIVVSFIIFFVIVLTAYIKNRGKTRVWGMILIIPMLYSVNLSSTTMNNTIIQSSYGKSIIQAAEDIRGLGDIPIYLLYEDNYGFIRNRDRLQYLLYDKKIYTVDQEELEKINRGIFVTSSNSSLSIYTKLSKTMQYFGDYEDSVAIFIKDGNLPLNSGLSLPLNQFSSQINTQATTDQIVSNGEAGFLLYGPYKTLDQGCYQITVTGKMSEGILEQGSFFDIVCNSGSNTIVKIEDLQAYVQNDCLSLSVDFEIPETVSNCEFRLYVNEGVICSIEDITLSSK